MQGMPGDCTESEFVITLVLTIDLLIEVSLGRLQYKHIGSIIILPTVSMVTPKDFGLFLSENPFLTI